MRRRDQNLIHGDLKQCAEGIEVVDAGQALSLLPFVNGLGLLEAKIGLQVPDREAPLFPQPLDIPSGGRQVNHGKGSGVHI